MQTHSGFLLPLTTSDVKRLLPTATVQNVRINISGTANRGMRSVTKVLRRGKRSERKVQMIRVDIVEHEENETAVAAR